MGLFYLKSYDDEIWYVGTLSDLEYDCLNRILNFGLGPIFWARTPIFGVFDLFNTVGRPKFFVHEIWHVGPLTDRKPLRSIRILIFGLGPFFGARTPFFGLFDLFKD